MGVFFIDEGKNAWFVEYQYKKERGVFMNDSQFFEVLGFLSNRNILIEAEVSKKVATKFEREYLEMTGELVRGVPEYYIIDDKWGKELRVYISDIANVPSQLSSILRTDTYKGYPARFNNNDIITRMFRYGFRIASVQDRALIEKSIPADYQGDFKKGQEIILLK